MCGELDIAEHPTDRVAGSSPRVRGTRGSRRRGRGRRRFIPACAGNSKYRAFRSAMRQVHPRVCGELCTSELATLLPVGSSPRVRGTRPCPRTSAASRRFIPACAGNSVTMRDIPEWDSRFIPACAGNSDWGAGRDYSLPVHPRVCGELVVGVHQPAVQHGSSPRVRGTPHRRLGRPGFYRFIPACAGNSPERDLEIIPLAGSSPRVRGTPVKGCRKRATTPVHPRVCGELSSAARITAKVVGSSPRVRGTQLVRGAVAERRRFIPACAGNSRSWIAYRSPPPVHPRVCGELLRRRSHGRARSRFIPACAGNSTWGDKV